MAWWMLLFCMAGCANRGHLPGLFPLFLFTVSETIYSTPSRCLEIITSTHLIGLFIGQCKGFMSCLSVSTFMKAAERPQLKASIIPSIILLESFSSFYLLSLAVYIIYIVLISSSC